MKLTDALELHGIISSDKNYSGTAIFADENGYRVETRHNTGTKNKMKITTYQSASGQECGVTPAQEKRLSQLGVWPRDSRGEEFAAVSHGLHFGYQSMADRSIVESLILIHEEYLRFSRNVRQ